MSRPEHTAPAELFYNEREARKYAQSTRMLEIQTTISERAIELLNLPGNGPAFLLDIGCGSGMSGNVIERLGHAWVGVDISENMLTVAAENIEDDQANGDVCLADMVSLVDPYSSLDALILLLMLV